MSVKTSTTTSTKKSKPAPAPFSAEQKIRIKLSGYNHRIIDGAALKIIEIAKATGASIRGPVPQPTKKEVFTVIRSPHKHKDSQEQFEMRTHRRLIIIVNPTPQTIESLTRLQLPSGVAIEIKL